MHGIKLPIPPQVFTRGVQLMLLATFSLSLMQSMIKQLDELHTFEIFFFRGLITTLICLAFLRRSKVSIWGIPSARKWLILRAITGIFSTCIFYFTLKWMPFGAAVSLKYLSPIFAAVFAVFLLKESLRWPQLLFFGMALGGVALLKGYDNRIETIALILSLIAAVVGGLAFLFIRKIGAQEHPLVIVIYYMGLTTISMGLLMIPFWRWPNLEELLLLFSIGLFGFIGQYLMTQAMQTEAVARIAPLKYLELVYALLIGLIWFGETYVWWSFFGIMLIMMGMILNVFYTKRSTKS